MGNLKRYTLKIKELSLGAHHFEYTVDDDFFAAFEGSEITHGQSKVELDATKQGSMVTLDFHITGAVEVACDRCLGNFMMPVDYNGTLLVKYSEEVVESDGEVMWIHPYEDEVNLAQYIYESIMLSLPYQKVHPLDKSGNSTCDPEMLKRFKIVSGEEFDGMFSEEAPDSETQSSWEQQLASVKEKLEQEEKKKK